MESLIVLEKAKNEQQSFLMSKLKESELRKRVIHEEILDVVKKWKSCLRLIVYESDASTETFMSLKLFEEWKLSNE